MPAITQLQLSPFALDVVEGLTASGQKKLSPRYFYDDLGSKLFEAITLLPEYGLTRAEERILQSHADDIASVTGPISTVAELGSGSGVKTQYVLRAGLRINRHLTYYPIDVSAGALAVCAGQLSSLLPVESYCGDWMDGLAAVASARRGDSPLLLLFLGSSIGNLSRQDLVGFAQNVRSYLRAGDSFLLGVDLVKEVDRMLVAYDDPIGVTAAFNLNLLARINRELGADFDLRSFAHEARWNGEERRVEMHLRSLRNQIIMLAGTESVVRMRAGETIWTESSHKFIESDLSDLAAESGFRPCTIWLDQQWPFAEALWKAV